MPTFVSGPELIAEEYLAGGLYFFVLARMRLELGDGGSATLAREIVVDSWYEPYEDGDGGPWSGTHDGRRIAWTHRLHGDAVTWVRRTDDDAWLVITTWEGEGEPSARAFQRLAPGAACAAGGT